MTIDEMREKVAKAVEGYYFELDQNHAVGRGERDAMMYVGGFVFLIGAFLWGGNVIGYFPTFPLVGYLTMLAGGALIRMDKGGDTLDELDDPE